MHLCLVGSAIYGDKFAANLHILDLGSEVGSIDEESTLIQTSEQGLKCKFGVSVDPLVLLEEVEKCSGPEVMALEAFMQMITKCIDQLQHVLNIEEMEAESVLIRWLVEISTVQAIPKSNVCIDLGGHELRQSAHTRHSLGRSKAEDQVLSDVSLDWVEILDLALAH